ncbi:MAG: bifunctional nicotinamidase/pyrazinamidase [Candidatus Lokiarchaeota archaeon]|nr:bifunctional nicotinamidase/pyrazinamidase [Candidatus Lokiarchaeota archaeon]
MIEIKKKSVLIVIDMQNDFLPGGALAVENGDQIIDGINKIAEKFFNEGNPVVFTQDWHPKNHASFASSHEGKNPGDTIKGIYGIGPVLWPDHCVQNTSGAAINERVQTKYGIAIVRKGYRQNIDSYSAFFENDHQTPTGLSNFLKGLGVKIVYICGLALDYCCYFSAIDAKSEGFEVIFLKNLTKGIDIPENNIQKALESMKNAEIVIIE